VKVVEGGLGQDLGKCHAAGQGQAPCDHGRDDECIEAPGFAPADSLGNRSRVGLGGTDEIGEPTPLCAQPLALASWIVSTIPKPTVSQDSGSIRMKLPDSRQSA
jgi:hypothetical protein